MVHGILLLFGLDREIKGINGLDYLRKLFSRGFLNIRVVISTLYGSGLKCNDFVIQRIISYLCLSLSFLLVNAV
jgi:hypothetical protein